MLDSSFVKELLFWMGVLGVTIALTFVVARSVLHSTFPPADCRCVEHCPCQVGPAGE